MLLSYWLFVISFALLCLLGLTSAFVGGQRIAPDEDKLVLLKLVVHLSFSYSVLRGLGYNY